MMKTIPPLSSSQAIRKIGIVVAAAILMAGCASTQPPVEQMAVSRAAMNNANSAGANEYAPIQLKDATDKMNAAERAMADKKYELALKLAEEAQVDAQLAGATARSLKAQKAAETVKEDSNVLRKEINRKTK